MGLRTIGKGKYRDASGNLEAVHAIDRFDRIFLSGNMPFPNSP